MPAKGRRVFREPNGLIVKEGARVMSLLDGTSKMSKSDPADGSRINLLDTAEEIAKKIKRCKAPPRPAPPRAPRPRGTLPGEKSVGWR